MAEENIIQEFRLKTIEKRDIISWRNKPKQINE